MAFPFEGNAGGRRQIARRFCRAAPGASRTRDRGSPRRNTTEDATFNVTLWGSLGKAALRGSAG